MKLKEKSPCQLNVVRLVSDVKMTKRVYLRRYKCRHQVIDCVLLAQIHNEIFNKI